MAENRGKSAFGEFEPESAVAVDREIVGAGQTPPTDEQVRALETLRAWDAMAQGAYPPNTVRAWRADWRTFTLFCSGQGESPLPASPHTVRAYVQRCMANTKKSATIRRYLATIARAQTQGTRTSRTLHSSRVTGRRVGDIEIQRPSLCANIVYVVWAFVEI
jgi:hypothetical protein